jgi:hypothetical protein
VLAPSIEESYHVYCSSSTSSASASQRPATDYDAGLSRPFLEEMKMKLVLLLIVIVIIGVFLGWFHFSSNSDAGKPNITVSVDKDKIEADKNKALNQMQDLRQKPADTTAVTTQKTQD